MFWWAFDGEVAERLIAAVCKTADSTSQPVTRKWRRSEGSNPSLSDPKGSKPKKHMISSPGPVVNRNWAVSPTVALVQHGAPAN